jgi:hypothetical protein
MAATVSARMLPGLTTPSLTALRLLGAGFRHRNGESLHRTVR